MSTVAQTSIKVDTVSDRAQTAALARQCDCEMEESAAHGHHAGGCRRRPAYKVHFDFCGITVNLCRDCYYYNTRHLRLLDWHILERF
jgi:hypothetical protein